MMTRKNVLIWILFCSRARESKRKQEKKKWVRRPKGNSPPSTAAQVGFF